MRNGFLLILLAVSLSLRASAPLSYGFEKSQDSQFRIDYVGFDSLYSTYETIADPYGIIDVYSGIGGSSYLKVCTYSSASSYGTVEIPGINLSKDTSYRISFYSKTDADNLLSAFLRSDKDSSVLAMSSYNLERRWTRYPFLYTSDSDQSCTLCLEFKTPDVTYFIDEISIEESKVKSVDYAGDMVRVDFGYPTNLTQLVHKVGLNALYPEVSCVSVIADTAVLTPVSVEYQSDGYLYAWVDEDLNQYSDVRVSFVNPESEDFHLLYQRPYSGPVMDFNNEKAYYCDNLMAISYYQMPPILVTSDPDEGSFNLIQDYRSFHFKFDKPLYLEDGNPVAVITGSGFSETLSLDSISEDLRELWYSMSFESKLYGDYTFSVYDCCSYKGGECASYSVNVTYGESEGDIMVYVDTKFAEGTAGTIPVGFHVIDNAGDKANGESSSGGRLMAFTADSDIPMGIYWGPRTSTAGGSLYYGDDRSGSKLYLAPGDYSVSFPIIGWESYRPQIEFSVYQKNNPSKVVFSTKFTPTNDAKRGTYFTGADFLEYKFSVTEASDYVLKWLIPYNSDKPWDSAALGDVRLESSSTPAMKYAQMLNVALSDAKTVLDKALSSENYKCQQLDDLVIAIKEYSDWKSTSPKAYRAAVGTLEDLGSQLTVRINCIDQVLSYIAYAAHSKKSYEGKDYSRLKTYEVMLKTVAPYQDIDVVSLDLDELEDIQAKLANGIEPFKTRLASIQRFRSLLSQINTNVNNYVAYRYDVDYIIMKNAYERYSKIDVITTEDEQFYGFVNDVQDILQVWMDDLNYSSIRTFQLSSLKSMAADLKADFSGMQNQVNELATLVDDQEIAEIYKLAIKAKVCELLAKKRETSFDLTCFMQNSRLYSEYDKGQDKLIHLCEKSPYPGWTVADGWGNDYICSSSGPSNANATASETKKVIDTGIGLDWGAAVILKQTLTNLPVGRYSLNAKMSAWGSVDKRVGEISFTQTDALGATSTSSIPFEGNLEELELKALSDRVELTLDFRTDQTWLFVDYITLTLNGGVVGHDYAADLEKINNKFKEKLTVIETPDSESIVEYFDLTGRRTEKPSTGISVKRTVMQDGSSVSVKVFREK